jgi:salicylate hydroxylase
MPVSKVVIIGAGLGGLTAALSLLKRGIDVEIYEQSDQLREAGAGIQLGANGTRVLYALGLADALAAVQVVPERRELRHWKTGETWNWFELGQVSKSRYGTPHLMFHRGDLHRVLSDAVRQIKPDVISLRKRCIGVRTDADEVEILFEGGSRAAAPLAIGADGIHSHLRKILFGPSKPEFTGCIAWRGLIDMDRLPKHLQRLVGVNWLGPHGFVLHYPVRRGELMNFVGCVERDDWQIESWVSEGEHGEVADNYRGWHEDVQTLIAEIPVPYKWALMVRCPMECWSKARITLLGDACHPTLPFLGQGAVMAMEDGYVLAACIAKYGDDPPAVFGRYEEIRKERTAMVVSKAAENRAMAFAPELAQDGAVTDAIMRHWLQERLKERLDWLYAYDATAVAV